MKLYYLAILDHVGRWTVPDATAQRIVTFARCYALQDWRRPTIAKPSEAVEYLRSRNRALKIFESAEERSKWAAAQTGAEALGLKQMLGLAKRGKPSGLASEERNDGEEESGGGAEKAAA